MTRPTIPAGRPAPVFLLDDDEAIRRSVSRLLTLFGYSVSTFAAPSEFFEAITPTTEGVVILDLRMTEMDGFEVQQTLTTIRSPLKVIFFTAYSTRGDKVRAMTSGAFGFLEKPFNNHTLLSLVARCQEVIRIQADLSAKAPVKEGAES